MTHRVATLRIKWYGEESIIILKFKSKHKKFLDTEKERKIDEKTEVKILLGCPFMLINLSK
jgi:hypothetical protein